MTYRGGVAEKSKRGRREDAEVVDAPPPGARLVERRRVRRRPRVVPFLLTGAVIGAILGVVLERTGEADPDLVTLASQYSGNQSLLIMLGAGALAGLFVGAVVFVVVDLITARR